MGGCALVEAMSSGLCRTRCLLPSWAAQTISTGDPQGDGSSSIALLPAQHPQCGAVMVL